MISRIELHNFMSHSCTVIEPAAGLTVLVGPNNCGKSAIVSALQILCENDKGDYMVRHGEDDCRVVAITDDGHRVEWRRINSVVSYSIDGEDVHRLQGGIPDSLHKILRLPKVETADSHQYDIHFGVQKAPIFLLDEPGSRAASFFASSSDASKLVEMQGLHRQKGAQARKEEARLTELVEELTGKLVVLEPVAQLEQAVKKAADSYVVLVDLCSRMESLDREQAAISQSLAAVAGLEAQSAALASLAAPPRLTDTTLLEETILLAEKIACSIAAETAFIQAFKPLAGPPDLAEPAPIEELMRGLRYWKARRDADEAMHLVTRSLSSPPRLAEIVPLEALCADLADWRAECEAASSREKCLVSLAKPPQLRDEQPLRELIGDLGRAREDALKLDALCTSLESVPCPPVPADPTALQELVTEVDDLRARLAGPLRDEVSEAEEALEATIKEIRKWATKNRLCPTCGVELNPERMESFVTSGMGKHQHG